VGNIDKPVYLCSITEDDDEDHVITIPDCELLIDSRNTACDLVLTYHDAKKFNLRVTKNIQQINQADGTLVVARMIPQLLVTFALADSSGKVTEKSAYLDVWVKLKDVPESALPKSFRDALAAERAQDEEKAAALAGTSLHQDTVAAPVQKDIVDAAFEATGAAPQKLDATSSTAPAPVNTPSPVKHAAHGSANLGKSGAKKLKLKYDYELNEISFMEDPFDFPEL
jgi:hypothetical protein